MKHDAKITISRPNCSSGRKYISIRIDDADAEINFLDIEIGLEEFSEALTGLGSTPCKMEIRGLENVGKKIEREVLEFVLPSGEFRSKEEAVREAIKNCPDGWTPSLYFGSQTSFFDRDGKRMARCNISRWVDKPE